MSSNRRRKRRREREEMDRLLRDGQATPDDLANLLDDPTIPGVEPFSLRTWTQSSGWETTATGDVPLIGQNRSVASPIREALERPAESVADALLVRHPEPAGGNPPVADAGTWGHDLSAGWGDQQYQAAYHQLSFPAWDRLFRGEPVQRPYLTQPELSAVQRRYDKLMEEMAALWETELYSLRAWERYWRMFQLSTLSWPDRPPNYDVDDAEMAEGGTMPLFFGLVRLDPAMARKDFRAVAERYDEERAKLLADPLGGDEAAFWRAVAAAPDDDLPRLVYADRLDERGDPFGGWIRASIAGEEDGVAYYRTYIGDRLGDKIVRLLGLELRGDSTHCPLEREAFRTTDRLSWGWDRGFPVSLAMPARYLEHFLAQRGDGVTGYEHDDPGLLCPVLPIKQLVITTPFSPERDFGHWVMSKASKVEQVVVVGNGRSSRRSANHTRHQFRNAVVLYTLGSQTYLTESLVRPPGQTRLLVLGEYVGREWQRLQMLGPNRTRHQDWNGYRPSIAFTHGLTVVNCPCEQQVQLGQHAWVNPGTPMFFVWGQCPSCYTVYMDGDPVPIMDNDQWAALRNAGVYEDVMWEAGNYAGRIEPSVSGFPVGRPRSLGDVQ